MTETLALALLGNPELTLAGQPLPRFRSAKVYALLYYLAVTRRAQPRTLLAGLFWSDVDEYYARRNLNRTLSDLTQFVGDHLVVERQTVTFARSQSYWLDVELLENAATTLPTTQTLTALAAAANHYHGDFLEGFYVQDAPEFEQWVLSERTRLRASALQLLYVLSQFHADQGELLPAIDYARRALQLEPWREEAHRQLMLLLAQSGQRSAALTQYELCRQALRSELDVEPDSATLDLVARIRAGSFDRMNGRQDDKLIEGKPVIQTLPPPVILSPPPVTLAPLHNLPGQRTPFVGRAAELANMTRLLIEEDDCRLLTLVGPGGMGKTRLALKVAEGIVASTAFQKRFADGLFFVPLENVSDENGLVSAVISVISREIGFALQVDVPPLAQLLHFLRTKSMLLVLDNFEHLVRHAEICSTLLEAAPMLKLLVTSRETLSLLEAWVYPLLGLTTPKDWVAIETQQGESDAVRFFAQCAQRARPGFTLEANRQAVLRICALAEGMPLGIELAAAWLKMMTCDQIAQEVARELDFLTTRYQNIPARHHSMRIVMDHSWALLTAEEGRALARLSIFRGGFRHAAAGQVANATLPILTALVDKSLLRLDVDGRFRIHELLRQYALEKLGGTAELTQVVERHGQYHAQVLHELTPALKGGAQLAATETMDADVDNLRMAWQWAVTQGSVDAIQQSAQAWLAFCHCQSRYQEGATLFGGAATALVSLPPTTAQQRTLLTVLIAQAWFLVHLRRFDDAMAVLAQSRALYQTLGQPPLTDYLCDPALPQGIIAYWQGDDAGLVRLGQEALQNSLTAQNPWNRQVAYYLLGRAARGLGQFAAALAHTQQALAVATQVGDRWFMSFCHDAIGSVALSQYDYALSYEHYRACFILRTEAKDAEGIARAQLGLGMAAYYQRDFATARLRLTDALTGMRRVHGLGGMASSLSFLGRVAVAELDYNAAQTYFLEALQTIRQLDAARTLLPMLLGIGELFCQTGYSHRGTVFITWVIEHPASEPALRSEAQTLLRELASPEKNLPSGTLLVASAQPPSNPALLIQTLIDELTNLSLPLAGHPVWR